MPKLSIQGTATVNCIPGLAESKLAGRYSETRKSSAAVPRAVHLTQSGFSLGKSRIMGIPIKGKKTTQLKICASISLSPNQVSQNYYYAGQNSHCILPHVAGLQLPPPA